MDKVCGVIEKWVAGEAIARKLERSKVNARKLCELVEV